MIKENVSQRLSEMIDIKYPNKTFMQIVRKHEFNYDSLRKVKEGKAPLGMKVFLQFLEILPDANLNWLFFGEGERFRSENTQDTTNMKLSPRITKEIITEVEGVLKKYEN